MELSFIVVRFSFQTSQLTLLLHSSIQWTLWGYGVADPDFRVPCNGCKSSSREGLLRVALNMSLATDQVHIEIVKAICGLDEMKSGRMAVICAVSLDQVES